MVRMRYLAAAVAVTMTAGASLPAAAQGSGQQPVPAPPPAATQAVSPEALTLARQLVAKLEPSPQQTVASMARPMVGMVQQMGIQQPDRAQAVVQEAVLPILNEHLGELSEMAANAYAQTLTVDDLKAVLAFYNTKAGMDLVAAQPRMTQLRLTNATQWISKLQPEIQTKIQDMAKAHGWTNN